MTREQKIEWLRKADTVALLRQYEVCVKNVENAYDLVGRGLGYTFDSIDEDYTLAKSELLKRLAK